MPSVTWPQSTALSVIVRNSLSPVGTEAGGRNAAATVLSLPLPFAAEIAPGSAARKRVDAAYGEPRVTLTTWIFERSKVSVAWAPLVGTVAFWMTRIVKVPSFAIVVVAGSIRSVFPAAETPAIPTLMSPTTSATTHAEAKLRRRTVTRPSERSPGPETRPERTVVVLWVDCGGVICRAVTLASCGQHHASRTGTLRP